MRGESRCSPREIQNYLNRISGPLLDRIDIHVEVPAVKFREITAERTGETSAQIRERVVAARPRLQERFPRYAARGITGKTYMSALLAQQINEPCLVIAPPLRTFEVPPSGRSDGGRSFRRNSPASATQRRIYRLRPSNHPL